MSRKKIFFSGYRLVPIRNIEVQLLWVFLPPNLQIEHFHDDYLEKWCVARLVFI